MLVGYRTGVILPSLALVAAMTMVAAPSPHPCSPDPSLYSARALRRMRILLELRLLELREERLDRARAVILRRLPVAALFGTAPKPPAAPPGVLYMNLKQKGHRWIISCE